MFKYFAMSIIFFASVEGFAQTHRTEVSYKGDVQVIKLHEDYKGLRDEDQFIDSELRLSSQARTTLVSAMQKGLSWAEINESKNIVFRKRIAMLIAKSSLYMSCCSNGGQFDRIYVVFEAQNGNEFNVILYGNNKNYERVFVSTKYGKQLVDKEVPFDIERPGETLQRFSSKKEVNDFIAVLNKQHVDLNQVFK